MNKQDAWYLERDFKRIADVIIKLQGQVNNLEAKISKLNVPQQQVSVEPEGKVQIAELTYKEIETYIDEYIDMGVFIKPEQAKPYLMDGFEKGYNYLKDKLSNLSS